MTHDRDGLVGCLPSRLLDATHDPPLHVGHQLSAGNRGGGALPIPVMPLLEAVQVGESLSGPVPEPDFTELFPGLDGESESSGEWLGRLHRALERTGADAIDPRSPQPL